MHIFYSLLLIENFVYFFCLQPLFLQRNLSYLKGRIAKRKFERRQKKPFDWSTFLKELKPSKNSDANESSLVFKFNGYYDAEVLDAETATTDIYLLSRTKHQPKLLVKNRFNNTIIRFRIGVHSICLTYLENCFKWPSCCSLNQFQSM